MITPIRLRDNGWWACDYCGRLPWLFDGPAKALAGEPVRLVATDEYRCGPCRGIPDRAPSQTVARLVSGHRPVRNAA